MAKIVTRAQLIIALYVHCLSCIVLFFGIFKAHCLLYISPSLTLRNSSLPTEGIFVFCIDIRTVIMYLDFINWLVSMTETECLMSDTT